MAFGGLPNPVFLDSTDIPNSSDAIFSESLPCPYCLKQSRVTLHPFTVL